MDSFSLNNIFPNIADEIIIPIFMKGNVIYAGIPFESARRTKYEEKKFGIPRVSPYKTVIPLIFLREENINIQLQIRAE